MTKKKAIVISICIAVLLSTIIVLIFVCAPSNSGEKEAIRSLRQTLQMPSTLVEGEETPLVITYIEKRSNYKFISFKKNKDGTATAKVRVTAPNLYEAVKIVEENTDTFSETEIQNRLVEAMQQLPAIQKTVTLVFVKEQGVLQPELTSEFLDVYYGGIIRLREELLNKQETVTH